MSEDVQFNLKRTGIHTENCTVARVENCIDLLWDRLPEHIRQIQRYNDIILTVPEALQFTESSNAY